jgi:hypothetical protein
MKSEIQTIRYSLSAIQSVSSTPVENVRQISFFMQNKPNFPKFSSENDDITQKQTQYKPKKPILPAPNFKDKFFLTNGWKI